MSRCLDSLIILSELILVNRKNRGCYKRFYPDGLGAEDFDGPRFEVLCKYLHPSLSEMLN